MKALAWVCLGLTLAWLRSALAQSVEPPGKDMYEVDGGYFADQQAYSRLVTTYTTLQADNIELLKDKATLDGQMAQCAQELKQEQAELRPTWVGWVILIAIPVIAAAAAGAAVEHQHDLQQR